MRSLNYLTIQDILWINLQVCKKVHHFSYAKLEEATFYQYAYGESNSLIPQAGRFLRGFNRLRPFDAGNEATAFVACATFLLINGKRIETSDAECPGWLDGAAMRQDPASTAFQEATGDDPTFRVGGKPDVRTTVEAVLGSFPETIASLADQTAAAS